MTNAKSSAFLEAISKHEVDLGADLKMIEGLMALCNAAAMPEAHLPPTARRCQTAPTSSAPLPPEPNGSSFKQRYSEADLPVVPGARIEQRIERRCQRAVVPTSSRTNSGCRQNALAAAVYASSAAPHETWKAAASADEDFRARALPHEKFVKALRGLNSLYKNASGASLGLRPIAPEFPPPPPVAPPTGMTSYARFHGQPITPAPSYCRPASAVATPRPPEESGGAEQRALAWVESPPALDVPAASRGDDASLGAGPSVADSTRTLQRCLGAGVDAVCGGESEAAVHAALEVPLLLTLPALHWHRAQLEHGGGEGPPGAGAAGAPLGGRASADAAPSAGAGSGAVGGEGSAAAAARSWRPRDVLWDKLWHERFAHEFGRARCAEWGACAMQWKERCVQALLLALAAGRIDALPQPRRVDLRALLAETVVSADCSGLRGQMGNASLHRLLLGCPLLQRLNLNGTHVSDAGLRALQHCCPRLCWLRLSATDVTSEGVHELLGWRPHLSVVV